jgi:hypothetical protein
MNDLATPTTPTGLAAPAPPAGSFGDTLQNSLAKPANGVPLSFNDKLKANSNAADAAMTPAQKAAPGAWARSLIAGAQHALGSVEDSLGDAATAAAEGPNYGGIAGAVGRLHNVQAARQQAQKTAQSEQDKNAATTAFVNSQKIHQQMLTHQLSDKLNDEDIEKGKALRESMTTALSAHHLQPGADIARDITESQLMKAVNDKSWDPTKETYMPTGSIVVPGKLDDQGQPLKQKLYSIVGIPQTQVLDKYTVDRINSLVPGVHFDYNADKPDAVKIPGAQAAYLTTLADTNELLQQQRDHVLTTAKLDKITSLNADDQLAAKDASGRLAKDPEYIKAQAQSHGNLQGMADYLQYPDPKTGRPRDIDAYNDMVSAYGGPKMFNDAVDGQRKDFAKQQDEDRKQQGEDEKERHDRIIEDENAQKEVDKKDKDNSYVGNDDAATSQEFLASLKPGEAATVKGIAEGSLNVGRMAYLLARNPALVAAVKRYDSNFDNSKVDGYAKMVTDFTTGKVGESLKSGATAMNHLRELYDLNTAGSRIPGTSDYQKFQSKLDTLASELATFYGNNTVSGIEGYKTTLGSFANRGAAITEQSKSMADRYDNIKAQWVAGAPSDVYYGKMPDINQKAKSDLAYVLNNGQQPTDKAQAAAALAPQGAEHQVVVGGKIVGHVVKGTYVPLGKTPATPAATPAASAAAPAAQPSSQPTGQNFSLTGPEQWIKNMIPGQKQ